MTLRKIVAVVLLLVGTVGCHFQAGFGTKAKEQSSTERDRDEKTVVNADGTSTTTETVVETVSFSDGSSTTVSTTTRTAKDKSGKETSRATSTTTTEKTANGSVTSSSRSSG